MALQLAKEMEFDFNVEPVFDAYFWMMVKEKPRSIPSVQDMVNQYEIVVNYKQAHMNPIQLVNIQDKLSPMEMNKVLQVFRMFHRDFAGRYHFIPVIEVW